MRCDSLPQASNLAESFAEAVTPQPPLRVSEWAEAKRIIPKGNAEKGEWRNARTPYLVEIMDCLSVDSPYEEVVFMKASRIGGTEALNNFLGYIIDHAPGPAVVYQPREKDAKNWSKQQLSRMIDETPCLKAKVVPARKGDDGSTVFLKEYPSGPLHIRPTLSAKEFRMFTAQYVLGDEVDAWELDVEGEGPAIDLSRTRTINYGTRKKHFYISSPTIKGLSSIERAYMAGDQRHYHVPCPFCGCFQRLVWARIKFDNRDPETTRYLCINEECAASDPRGKGIDEAYKRQMLAGGRWVKTATSTGRIASFHLSGLYSPLGWLSWKEIVREHFDIDGNPLARKKWTNHALAETYEDQSSKPVDELGLFNRREHYACEVPAGVALLTMGVDTQDDRLVYEVVGWGPNGEESWSIHRGVINQPPSEQYAWDVLDEIIRAKYEHELGGELPISAVCIDSAGHHTNAVYQFCATRHDSGVYAIIGRAGDRPVWNAKASWENEGKIALYTIGVDAAKDQTVGRLKIDPPEDEAGNRLDPHDERYKISPGYCHFPVQDEYDLNFFKEFGAERKTTRYVKGYAKTEWVKIRPRNEALDCRNYSYGALLSVLQGRPANTLQTVHNELLKRKHRRERVLEPVTVNHLIAQQQQPPTPPAGRSVRFRSR